MTDEPQKLRVLDLFSGIGGFSLGLERTGGFETVAFCEIEPYCQAVLRKHWPDVPIFDDVRELTADAIGPVDIICGGFPCQDLSAAGHQVGITGNRSGLWSELCRLVGEIRPRYAIVENVPNLLAGERGRWFGRVLGDLAEIGFNAEWHCIPASAVGAPHRRDRVWIIASDARHRRRSYQGRVESEQGESRASEGRDSEEQDRELDILVRRVSPRSRADWWRDQSSVARTVNGLPAVLERARGCGNAVVPSVVENIGRAILEAEKNR